MANDDQPDYTSETGYISNLNHFALREIDRGDKGALLRLFDELDQEGKQDLLRHATQLLRRPHAS